MWKWNKNEKKRNKSFFVWICGNILVPIYPNFLRVLFAICLTLIYVCAVCSVECAYMYCILLMRKLCVQMKFERVCGGDCECFRSGKILLLLCMKYHLLILAKQWKLAAHSHIIIIDKHTHTYSSTNSLFYTKSAIWIRIACHKMFMFWMSNTRRLAQQ